MLLLKLAVACVYKKLAGITGPFTTNPLPSLSALLVLPLLTIIVLFATFRVLVLVLVVVPVTVKLPVRTVFPVTFNPVSVPTVCKLEVTTVVGSVVSELAIIVAGTVIFAVPSKFIPLIVRAVCKAVAVPALPVIVVAAAGGTNVNNPVVLLYDMPPTPDGVVLITLRLVSEIRDDTFGGV
jgi:hypothetical protein